jgi:hypothetical protein
MVKAEFLIPRPADTDGNVTREKHDQQNMTFMIYRSERGEELRWSAGFSLPKIGDRIRITINSIGEAEVTGFFKEGGFVGVMTKALDPPKWLKEQREKMRNASNFDSLPEWLKEGIGCQFGAEITLL